MGECGQKESFGGGRHLIRLPQPLDGLAGIAQAVGFLAGVFFDVGAIQQTFRGAARIRLELPEFTRYGLQRDLLAGRGPPQEGVLTHQLRAKITLL